MIHAIPIENAAILGAFYFTVDLDGQMFRLNFQYNDREGFWYMDVLDQYEAPVRLGIKCVVNWPLLKGRIVENRPPGELMIVDTRGEVDDPSLDSLGVDHQLVYLDAEEMAA